MFKKLIIIIKPKLFCDSLCPKLGLIWGKYKKLGGEKWGEIGKKLEFGGFKDKLRGKLGKLWEN